MTNDAGSGSGDRLEPVARHESRIFFLDFEDYVLPIDHDRYVALARGEVAAPEFAGRRLILVDWYLRLAGARPEAVVSEICSWIVFERMKDALREWRDLLDGVPDGTSVCGLIEGSMQRLATASTKQKSARPTPRDDSRPGGWTVLA